MTYKANRELPKSVRDALPSAAQTVFRNVVNSVLGNKGSEDKAFRQAWGALKNQGWHKTETGKWVKKMQETSEARVVKVSEELGLVFGWAIVCKVDGEDYYDHNIDKNSGEAVPEHIPEDAMLKAATDFMAHTERSGNEMHVGPDSGQFVFAWPMTTDIAKALGIETPQTGLLVAYKPTPEVLAKYKDGTYRGFSIEGVRVKSEELTND